MCVIVVGRGGGRACIQNEGWNKPVLSLVPYLGGEISRDDLLKINNVVGMEGSCGSRCGRAVCKINKVVGENMEFETSINESIWIVAYCSTEVAFSDTTHG